MRHFRLYNFYNFYILFDKCVLKNLLWKGRKFNFREAYQSTSHSNNIYSDPSSIIFNNFFYSFSSNGLFVRQVFIKCIEY